MDEADIVLDALALVLVQILFDLDFSLFAANLAKIRDGGWIPLAFGTLVFATGIKSPF